MSKSKRLSRAARAGASLALITGFSVQAALTMTPAGIADGFSLSTVITNGYSATYGPLGEAILPDGNFITGSEANGKLYIFRDVNGQTLADAVAAIPYTGVTSNPQYVMATVGGQAYGAQVSGGSFVRFANDGSMSVIPGLSAISSYLGMWGDIANGHLVASTFSGLVDIDPIAGTYRVINANVFPDGVTVSNDGTTVYAEVGGNINSYNFSNGAFIRTYSGGGHSPDGTGAIFGGAFNGDIIVNNNDGTVGLIDIVSGTETIIASGGTRGDFVSPDTNDGSLFLSQSEQVVRLSCGPNCSIGSVSNAPEPSTFGMMAMGLMGAILARRKLFGAPRALSNA